MWNKIVSYFRNQSEPLPTTSELARIVSQDLEALSARVERLERLQRLPHPAVSVRKLRAKTS